MDEIIKWVNPEHKEWVSSLTMENIGVILNTLSMIPHMKIKYESVSEIPSNIGKAGEMAFENIVSQFMPSDYKLEDTAKQGYKGDFILTWQSYKTNQIYKILIDIKNYKTTVPQKEIDKFYRDVKMNSDIDGGLLLSLNGKIVGISKIIEFKDLNTDRGNVPLIFTKSSQPEIICEVIKLLFHSIEIKDLNSNEILHRCDLVTTINELSDQVQLITNCRTNLQNSKHDIEKSINDIMFNLMQCEYNLATKIKQINKSLSNEINVIVPEPNQNIDEKINMVDYVIEKFKNSIELKYDSLLNNIYNLGWDCTSVDFDKKHWQLTKTQFNIIIKFNKKNMTICFSIFTDEIINLFNCEKKIKYTKKSDGFHILLNPDSIDFIIKLCNSYK
jgi:hypothetical protein